MSTAKEQFLDFCSWLRLRDPPEDIADVAAAIYQHFDEVAERGTAANRRARYLKEHLCNVFLIDAPLPLPGRVLADQDRIGPWHRLRSLTVGPFRGFRFLVEFDLSSQITLIGGPNGTGKSSVCQALEYAMLGTVLEGEEARLDVWRFLQNSHQGVYVDPVLTAVDNEGNQVQVLADADRYGFCFIEKQRIDAFARIATRTPRAKEQQISALFGVDKFHDFCRGFSTNIDTVLVLSSSSASTLEQNRLIIANDIEAIANEADALSALSEAERAIAADFDPAMTPEALKAYLGTPSLPGRIHEIQTSLGQLAPKLSGVKRSTFERLLVELEELAPLLAEKERLLAGQRDKVSFKALYSAVLQLRTVSPDACPACDTPLSEVKVDPYSKADSEIRLLAELNQLEVDIREFQNRMTVLESNFGAVLRSLATHPAPGVSELQSEYVEIAEMLEFHGSHWKYIREIPTQAGRTMFDSAISIATALEAEDARINGLLADRAALVAELERLRLFQQRLAVHAQSVAEKMAGLQQARRRIAEFNLRNEVLEQSARAEQAQVAIDTRIKSAYEEFVRLLETYRHELPGRLMGGLNDLTRTLYNGFNREDQPGDLLAAVRLPLGPADRISIAFAREPQQEYDALHVLSEGHIRCLGLAILLAKNIDTGSPLIIFDDAVNAIDHDHRLGIQRTIFDPEGPLLAKQIIVTCHNPEFLTSIQNELPAAMAANTGLHKLAPHDGDGQPRVYANRPSERYLDEAQRELEQDRRSSCLHSCRLATELLSMRLWRWLGGKGQGDVSISLDGPARQPELRNLLEQLKLKLDSATFAHPRKAEFQAPVNALLGLPQANFYWRYMNRGSHYQEGGAEFDRAEIGRALQALRELEAAFTAGLRR